MITVKQLVPFAKANLNVLLRGGHGVGKTAIVKEVFNEVYGEHGKKWQYFSASTMDPFVDFIGIPKPYTRPDGVEVFGMIPNENFAGDSEIEALFFDEINRGDAKTLNGIMELIQFKTLNGKPFGKLKVIWAAENPSSEGVYMVQPLDPAQKDRFQIQLDMPNELSEPYFSKKYGNEAFKIAYAWWNKNKAEISPRKLDDMLAGWQLGFDVALYSNDCKTTREFQNALGSINVLKEAMKVAESGNSVAIKQYFTADMLRKYSKNFTGNQNLFGKIYSSVGGEQQALIETMGYRVPRSLDTATSFAAEDVETLKKIVLANEINSSVNPNYVHSFVQHTIAVEKQTEKLNFSQYKSLSDFAVVVGDIGPEKFKNYILGSKSFDINMINSGYFSDLHKVLVNDTTRINAFRHAMKLLFIAIYEARNDLKSSNATRDAATYWHRVMKSNIMMKLLVRNSARYKNLASALNTTSGKIEHLSIDLNKLFG